MLIRFLFGAFLWLLAIPVGATAAPAALSGTARVSLLTCAPGPEMYALFGHSALRITDPARELDRVYNYGTFDFQTPNFYWRFLRGDLRYFLSATSSDRFQLAYQQENRTLSEQVLDLDPTEAQRIYHRLETTLHSPARYYRYQFFADNCTTRLFELISTSLTAPARVDSSYAAPAPTYRQLLAPYLAPAPWVKLGMNLGLGWPADQSTTFRQRLFLPTELADALARMTRRQRPFVSQAHPLFVATQPAATNPVGFPPALCFLVIGATSLLAYRLPARFAGPSRIMRRGLFVVVGLVGCVLLGLSWFSLHAPTHSNYQLLWLLPTHLVLGFARPNPRWQLYTTISLVLLVLSSLLGTTIYYAQLLPEVGLLLTLLFAQLVIFRRQCRLV
ncbi:hypothetical protein CDA63_16540 [Hymenobacter amundsenii]|uniref:Uncharacterized protein n=1 Tax=Hymenobacter amundsenii TaxID=2006685 RepID=A0A246FHE9_9BACT|nr:DUF4105 domain-containing protein [Hymenobacter amundsenii]OWP61970.1 hypothetical protein CDA63_16540 [Hymenobacter amundsenii]